MQVLIRSARVVDAASPVDGQVVDILVENGLIRQLGENLSVDANTVRIESDDLHVSTGWVDMRVQTQDPGYEYKEDIDSLCRAAVTGGFTDIAVLPNTQPVIDDKGTLGYVRRMAEGQPVTVHVIAAITKKAAGEDFTEMLDLHHAGAVAFSDGTHPLQNPDLFLKTLQYLQPINGLLMNRPEEQLLTRFGQMHEGIQSTLLGLKGMPSLAEELIIERDLRLLDYVLKGREETENSKGANSVLHFSTISTACSVDLIRRAKAAGRPVSCDVAAHQLVFDDAALAGFDTNLKVNPPFRSPEDVEALWQGLADETIDAIVSDHSPQDAESKNVEFDQAEFGIIGLETAFAVLLTHNKQLSIPQLIDKLTVKPRQILRLLPAQIAEGQPAHLTLFDPSRRWVYERIQSKSKNSPFIGQPFTGRVIGTFHRGRFNPVP